MPRKHYYCVVLPYGKSHAGATHTRVSRIPSGVSVLRRVLAIVLFVSDSVNQLIRQLCFACARFHRVEIDLLIYSVDPLRKSADARSWPRKSGLQLTNTSSVLHRKRRAKKRNCDTILFSHSNSRDSLVISSAVSPHQFSNVRSQCNAIFCVTVSRYIAKKTRLLTRIETLLIRNRYTEIQ